MNREQIKTWSDIVHECQANVNKSVINVISGIRRDAIIAADNEIKALRGEIARLKGEAK